MDYPATLALFGGRLGVGIEVEGYGADRFNYAVLGGAPSDGLVVVDYDDRQRGVENPIDTLTVETAKGLHYYIRVRSGARIGNRSFPRTRLDIRGQGGIAIAPPSQHPSGAMYRLVRDCPIREVTEDWFNSYLATVLAKYGETNRGSGSLKPRGWFAETFSATTEEGGRDSTLASMTGYLLNANLTLPDTRAILLLWAEYKCDPPLDVSDVDRVLTSLVRKREFDEARQTRTPAQPVAVEVPRTVGPEDDNYADLA